MRGDPNAWFLPRLGEGYITAWRWWRPSTKDDDIFSIINNSQERLFSIFTSFLWPPNSPLIATYFNYQPTPKEGGSFFAHVPGIFAYKTEAIALNGPVTPGYCGRVALWGNIAEHERGYRAQYAYPLSLDYLCCLGFRDVGSAQIYLEHRKKLLAVYGLEDGGDPKLITTFPMRNQYSPNTDNAAG